MSLSEVDEIAIAVIRKGLSALAALLLRWESLDAGDTGLRKVNNSLAMWKITGSPFYNGINECMV